MIESGVQYIDDQKIVEISKKLAVLVSDSYRLPDVFSDIHDQICSMVQP
jgi:hypothetical protein